MNLSDYLKKDKLILLSLRGISIVAKFLFTVLYFKSSEADFGEYNLVAVTILLMVYLLGLDFYSYANREILKPQSDKQKIIFNQFIFYILLYILLLPVVYILFHLLHFNSQYQILFYLVLISEHLNFEFYRLLFVFKKPLAANINLFLRNGLWVSGIVIILWLQQEISIDTVLKFWLAGNMAALIFSWAMIINKKKKIIKSSLKPDFNWIKNGVIISIPYILGTISYKTIEFADRYMINSFIDKKAVGVYSFFANMANVINIVLFTLVVSVLYPYIVEGITHKDQQKFKTYYTKFKKEIFIYSGGLLVLLSILLPIILMGINKTQYLKDFHIFLLLALSNILLNWSFLYHYILYAHKKDWTIFYITFIAAFINVLLNYLLIPNIGITGAALATFISFLLIWLLKYRWQNSLNNIEI